MAERTRPLPPTVVVLAARPADPASEPLRALLAGIEEQGVPCEVSAVEEAPAEELAVRAAERSRLEVGVGVAADGSACVTHRTLPPGRTVCHVPPGADVAAARWAGRAAARVVVGLPLED